jgi:hypothetical protein
MSALDLSPPSVSPTQIKRAKTPFSQAILVCGKCARKFPGGRKAVKKALKAELKSRRWGKVRLVETRCFDLCPKRRQVLASARTLGRQRLVVVEPGFEAGAALEELLGPSGEEAAAEQGLALPG